MYNRPSIFTIILLWTALCGALQAEPQSNEQRWIWIDTQNNTLRVMEGEQAVETFLNVSVGRNGTAYVRERGDGKTPLGTYHLRWINRDSRYHIFLGLDYPNDQQAEVAWRNAVIDFDTYYDIRRALVKGRVPPQDTPLGGYIGIHGTGDTSERLHKYVNWTQGCVALTNQQIEKLSDLVRIGAKVIISNGLIPATTNISQNASRENQTQHKVSYSP